MSTDVSAVRAVVTVKEIKGKDVVLVMHSHGAVVGCEALRRTQITNTCMYSHHFGLNAAGMEIDIHYSIGAISGC